MISRRVRLLAGGLRGLRLAPGDRAVVLMSDLQCEDAQVGAMTARYLGLDVRVVHLPIDAEEARTTASRIAAENPRIAFVCARGVSSLREARARTVLVADAPGALWGRAIELFEACRLESVAELGP